MAFPKLPFGVLTPLGTWPWSGSQNEPLGLFPSRMCSSTPSRLCSPGSKSMFNVSASPGSLRLLAGSGQTQTPLPDIGPFCHAGRQVAEELLGFPGGSASVGTGYGAKGPPGTLERSGDAGLTGSPPCPQSLGNAVLAGTKGAAQPCGHPSLAAAGEAAAPLRARVPGHGQAALSSPGAKPPASW